MTAVPASTEPQRRSDAIQDGSAPLVTAVVTTFDRPELARRSIGSVLAQTYAPLQVVVVEDGSDSGFEGWLRDAGLDRVNYVRHSENRGLAAARNTGLDLARGDYVAYLDDDDEWKPRRIERQMELLGALSRNERELLGVVYCAIEVRESEGSGAATVLWPSNRGNLREAIMREGARTLSSTCLFSRAALKRVGGFDEALPSSIDHDIWMSLACCGYEARAIDEPLVVSYASVGERMTGHTERRIEGVRHYVAKWSPVYREWLGEAGGRAYEERYFRGVIGRLAADKLLSARFRQAWLATRAVFAHGGRPHSTITALAEATARGAARRVLPRRVMSWIRGSIASSGPVAPAGGRGNSKEAP